MSGTPVHVHPGHLYTQDGEVVGGQYEMLFSCLAVEYRKAGGYFMKFLEKLENKVYINSLLFWREVQKYKALFVGKTFSLCAVEMKSKVSNMHALFNLILDIHEQKKLCITNSTPTLD